MDASLRSGNGLRQFIVRYQMAVFVVLTLVVSWAFVIPAEGGLIPHGPMIAAFIVLAIVSGRRGVSELWQQMTRWRVNWKWYLIAAGIFSAIHVFALTVSVALGAEIANPRHIQSLPAYLGLLIPLVFFGGQWEEPGWLGYTLRHFQERFVQPPFVAVFAAGIIRMVWHTPLLLHGTIPWYDYLFSSLAMQIFLTWLYNQTNRSVLIPMICHLFSNVAFATVYPLIGDADQGRYWLVFIATESLLALALVIWTRGRLGMRGDGGSAKAR